MTRQLTPQDSVLFKSLAARQCQWHSASLNSLSVLEAISWPPAGPLPYIYSGIHSCWHISCWDTKIKSHMGKGLFRIPMLERMSKTQKSSFIQGMIFLLLKPAKQSYQRDLPQIVCCTCRLCIIHTAKQQFQGQAWSKSISQSDLFQARIVLLGLVLNGILCTVCAKFVQYCYS